MNGIDWESMANKAFEKVGLKCSPVSVESETNTSGSKKDVMKRNRDVLTKKIGVYKSIIANYESELLRLRQLVSDTTRRSVSDEASQKLLKERREYMLQEYHNRYRNRYNTPEAHEYMERIKAETGNIPNVTNIDSYHIITDRRISYNLKEVFEYASAIAKGTSSVNPPVPKIEPWQGDVKTLIDDYESVVEILKDDYLDPLQDRLYETNCLLNEYKN